MKNLENLYDELTVDFESINKPDWVEFHIHDRMFRLAMEIGAMGGAEFGYGGNDGIWFEKGLEEIIWAPCGNKGIGALYYKMDGKIKKRVDYEG